MAILKKKEIRTMPAQTVKDRLNEIQKEMLKLGGQRSTGASQKNNQQIKILKRTRARLLTRLGQGGKAKQ